MTRPKLPLTITEPNNVPPFTGGLSGLSFVGLEEPDGVCHVVVAAMGAENALAMANRVVAACNTIPKLEALATNLETQRGALVAAADQAKVNEAQPPVKANSDMAREAGWQTGYLEGRAWVCKCVGVALRDILKEVS